MEDTNTNTNQQTQATEPTETVDVDSLTNKLHKSNSEAKSLRTRLKAMEAEMDKVKSTFGIDSITDEWLSNTQNMYAKSQGVDTTTKKYELDAKRAREEAASYKSQIEALNASMREKARDSMIMETVSKLGVRSDAITAAVKLIASESEYDGDSDTWTWGGRSINDYATTWAKNNSYMLGNPVKNGTASTKSASPSANEGFISQAEFLAMPKSERIKPEISKRILESQKHW